jgi:hypothetical protein
MNSNYGDNFEKPLIVIISLVIVASLAGTVALVAAKTPDCTTTDFNFCGHDSGF